jgi:hypothetical protein
LARRVGARSQTSNRASDDKAVDRKRTIGRIGKYTVEKELGQGGFGKVCPALDPDAVQPLS